MPSSVSASQTPAEAGRRIPFGTIAALLGASTLLLHLPFNGRYGFFRDELYFIACGRRLAWGYVDQPPLIAAICRLAVTLTGDSLLGFRIWANLGQAILVVLTAAF